jgi:hypothetical protein
MQDQGIAGRERASVSGLGVCDVWRLELTAEQWPWLVDELEEVRGPLEEELRRLWAQQATDDNQEVAREVSAREYELRLVRMMRAQLPAADHEGDVVFVGPAELVRELVRAVLTNVADALGERVEAVLPTDAESRVRLVETADAAAAWARTFVDCHELEVFRFDPAADPQRVGKILGEAAMLASERLEQQGRPPLPRTSPHTLRRTYISIALIANNFDVKWVMSQVGHADSSMTMDVYAQLEQRVNRQHGTAFDALLREARGHEEDREKATKRPRDPSELEVGALREVVQAKKKPANAGFSDMARPGLEPGTPRFSVVCSTN